MGKRWMRRIEDSLAPLCYYGTAEHCLMILNDFCITTCIAGWRRHGLWEAVFGLGKEVSGVVSMKPRVGRHVYFVVDIHIRIPKQL